MADKQKSEAQIVADETNEISRKAKETAANAEKELAKAIPALEKAKAAVGGL